MYENHVSETISAYALGALDRDEMAQVEQHLANCTICQAELRAYQAVVERLPLVARQHTPAPDLRQRILDQAARSHAPRPEVERARPASWWQRVFHSQAAPAWALAGLVLILALLVSNLVLWQQVQRLQAAQAAPLTVALSGTEAAPGASGLLVSLPQEQQVILLVEGLPALSEAQQYQLWLVRDGQRTSGAVFSVQADGSNIVAVSSPNPLDTYAAFGITVEPAGGSPGPTGDRVLGGSF